MQQKPDSKTDTNQSILKNDLQNEPIDINSHRFDQALTPNAPIEPNLEDEIEKETLSTEDTAITKGSQIPSAAEKKDNWRLFWKIYPYVVATASIDMVAGLINSYMAAKVSIAGMAGIAIATSILSPIVLFVRSLLQVAQSQYGFLLGQKKYTEIGDKYRQGYWLVILTSIIAMGITFLFANNLWLFKISPELQEIAKPYMYIRAFQLPLFAFLMNLFFLNASVAYRLPSLIASILSLVLIVPLNYLLMYGYIPGLEANVIYSAYGNIVDYAIVIVVYIYLINRKKDVFAKFKLFNPLMDKINIKELISNLKHGFPLGLQMLLINSFFTLFILLIAHLGTSVVAANQLTMLILGLMLIFSQGATSAVYTITSMRLGERKRYLIKHGVNISLAVAVSAGLLGTLASLFYGDYIAGWYLKSDPLAHEIAGRLIFLISIFNFLMSIFNIYIGYLMSFRDNYFNLWLTIIVQWCIALPLSIIVAFTDWFGFSPQGIDAFYYGFLFIGLAFVVSSYFRYRQWENISDEDLYIRLQKRGLQ